MPTERLGFPVTRGRSASLSLKLNRNGMLAGNSRDTYTAEASLRNGERSRRYLADLGNIAGAAPDAELLYPATQSARMQIEKARRAIGAVDLPARTLENLDDMGAVDLLES
jgi:hypothetical protein